MGLVAQELIGDTGQLSIRRVLPSFTATRRRAGFRTCFMISRFELKLDLMKY